MISIDKKYTTRIGRRSVRILCIDSGIPHYPVVGVADCGGAAILNTYTADGHYLCDSGGNDPADLVEVVEPRYSAHTMGDEWHIEDNGRAVRVAIAYTAHTAIAITRLLNEDDQK